MPFPEICQADLPTYLSQPEVVLRVSKRALEMNGTARATVGGRPLAIMISIMVYIYLFIMYIASATVAVVMYY